MVRHIALASLSLLLVGSLAAHLAAAPPEGRPTKTAVGTIVAVADDSSQFTLQMGHAEQSHKMIFKVDDKTTYELDGQTSDAAAVLKTGAHATVKYTGETATSVAVTTEKPGKDKTKEEHRARERAERDQSRRNRD